LLISEASDPSLSGEMVNAYDESFDEAWNDAAPLD
jgi:hypothetical protein